MAENLIQITKERSFVSRSAILEHFVCPYKHYLTYWVHGTGLHPARQSLDLLIGSTIHRGLQHLFEHCRVEHPDGNFEEACVDEAVEIARDLWREELSKRPLGLKSSAEYDRLDWIIAEQECLFEGLIRAFAIHKLPGILEEYEILEVEKEEVFEGFSTIICNLCAMIPDKTVSIELAEKYLEENNIDPTRVDLGIIVDGRVICPACNGTGIVPHITFLGKADGLFLRKRDNALVVLSIKTTSQYADVTTRDILHDMQGVSESYLVQERLERWWNIIRESDCRIVPEECNEDVFRHLILCNNNPPKILGVQYEYLVKGQRRKNTYDESAPEEYFQQSFLCHPMKFDAVRKILLGKGGSSLNPAEYKWKWGKGRQPKGWDKCDIWNDIGIKTWVEMLATGQVQPELGHPFDNILFTPDLIVRGEDEIKEWLVSTRYKAEQIRNYVDIITTKSDGLDAIYKFTDQAEVDRFTTDLQETLWQYFPKNTLSCHDFYGNDCQYVRHCHELQSIEEMKDAGELIERVPHHELEREILIEKGLIEDE